MIAVILAGGSGSRMGDRCRDLPKPMLCIDRKPILQRQLEALSKEGISDFLFVVGYLHEKILDYFGDGQRFGVRIRYYIEPQPMGTGGALKKLGLCEDFLLLNGDLLFDMALQPLLAFHFERKARITLVAHPNAHPHDSTLLQYERSSGRAVSCGRYAAGADEYPNLCNAGIQVVSPAALELAQNKDFLNFDRDILLPNICAGHVYAYRSSEYIIDVGTPQRLQAAEADLRSDLPAKRRRDAPQRAVFLDRDGTINRYKGYLRAPEEMELLPGAASAIRTFHALGYLVIVVTNQPVVARGECSLQTLQRIHNRMERLLGAQGAYVDDVFFCPHHPDAGFPNENRAYKIRCGCRKPSPGLLLQAKAAYNIDLGRSFMVGDSATDAETARSAGCTPVYLRCGLSEDHAPADVTAFDDLADFAAHLLQIGERA